MSITPRGLRIDFERAERKWHDVVPKIVPTLRYWMQVEVHVYGFSIAANVLLSFFPFLIVLVSLCRYVFHWDAAEQAIFIALHDYFPGDTGDFLVRNLTATVSKRGPFQVGSILLLLFTANGIFEPLEVALNRAWGIHKTRSFWRNQLVSMGLILGCGALAVTSTVLTAMQVTWLKPFVGSGGFGTVVGVVLFKVAAVPATALGLFLVYWVLPFGPVPWRRAFNVSVWVALALEVMKYLNLLLWPVMRRKLEDEYGPFVNSATILVLSFLASMIVMAGAEWTARQPLQAGSAETLDGPDGPDSTEPRA